ncbi:MAG: OmpH family outer membrane protein [Verrucomicrobiales bacterium]
MPRALPCHAGTNESSELAAPARAEAMPALRIATVDMKQVFSGYHKTTDAERSVNEAKADARRALDDRSAKYKALISKWQEKQKAINDPQINEILRVQLQKSASEIAAEAKALERAMAEFRSRRERQLQAHVMRLRRAILDEIQAEVIDAARRENFDLLFDSSGESLGGTPFLLYSKDVSDLSESILKRLNAGKDSR